MLTAQGRLDDALAAYRASLAIAERLAAADPNNASWQRDLSVSYDRVGDVLSMQGRLDDALAAYRASLAIRERLAAAEPDRADYQRDIVVSLAKLSNAGVSPDATEALTRALRIVENLAASGRLAAADSWMLDELRRRLEDGRLET